MKNAIIAILLIGSAIGLGALAFRQGDELVQPSDEPVADKVLTISPGKILEKDALGNITLLPDADSSDSFNVEDLNAVIEADNVEAGSGIAFSRGLVEHDDEEVVQNLITFTNQDFLYTFEHTLEGGRFFQDDEAEFVAVVGQSLKKELEEKGSPVLGETLNVRGQEHTIIGILNTIDTGNPSADADWNKLLAIPFGQAKDIFETKDLWLRELRLIAHSSRALNSAASEVTAILLERREKEDFTVLTPADVKAIDDLLRR